MTIDRPTIPERYSRSVGTSHLEVTDERGDIDMLIASGFMRAQEAKGRENLGVMLYRVRCEWDRGAGEYRLAQRHLKEVEQMGRILLREAGRELSAKTETPLDEAMARGRSAGLMSERSRMLQSAEAALDTARVLSRTHLKSMDAAAAAMADFAVYVAGRKHSKIDESRVRKIAGVALEVWLEDRCAACDSRGFTGGFLTPKTSCQVCRNTGRRPIRLGDSDVEHNFGCALIAAMEQKCDATVRAWRRWLSQSDQTEAVGTAAAADMAKRLTNLRSAQAEED